MALCISPRGHTQKMKKIRKVEGSECQKLVTQVIEEQETSRGQRGSQARFRLED